MRAVICQAIVIILSIRHGRNKTEAYPMIFLIVTACFAGSCSDHTIGWTERPEACVAISQIAAAAWAGDHPGAMVRRVWCRDKRAGRTA